MRARRPPCAERHCWAVEGELVESAVKYLEAAIMPEMAAFGESLSRAAPWIATETFSHCHATVMHSLGLSCFPTGSNALDAGCVALIVNVFDHVGLSLKGYVAWQFPSHFHEAETPFAHENEARIEVEHPDAIA